MPDEVGPDHNDISELRRLVRELLERQQEVDQMLGTDPHAAVKDATAWMLDSVVRLAEYITAGSPSRVTPGASLVRLLAALEDRDRGVSNPLLLPVNKLKGNNLLLMAGLLRVEPAVAMELLIRAGRGRDAAAREVARMMGENHWMFANLDGGRPSIVARWRTNIMSGDYPDAKQKFEEYLEAVTEFVRSRDGSAEDLVRIARIALRELDRYG